jgi:ppGpp synthetase/RelA/SpoT-type nucleotidyltranferase
VGISEKVISEAVARYQRERDRYIKLASRVADLCRTAIVEDNAIRAQVTSRTKTVRSFEGKLRRFARRPDKSFATADEVFAEIGDFAGVRIATYRPEDEVRVAQEVAFLFCGSDNGPIDIDPKDKLNPPKGQFYRATHCQVHLPEHELVGNYDNLRGASCEIQICSMMAHVWNEIEHDIGYKPEGEGPSEAEVGLLESLGHLTRAGDATITRLLAANIARMTVQTGDFMDIHDFVARLRQFFPDADLSVNAGLAFDESEALGLRSVDRIRAELGEQALDPALAAERIDAFNAYLLSADLSEFSLNRVSADLYTIALLERFAADIVANHTHKGAHSKGRPSRMLGIARAYLDYQQQRASGAAEAA